MQHTYRSVSDKCPLPGKHPCTTFQVVNEQLPYKLMQFMSTCILVASYPGSRGEGKGEIWYQLRAHGLNFHRFCSVYYLCIWPSTQANIQQNSKKDRTTKVFQATSELYLCYNGLLTDGMQTWLVQPNANVVLTKRIKPLFLQISLHVLCDFTIQIGGGWASSWSSVRNLWTEASRGTQGSAEVWRAVILPQPVLCMTVGVLWGRVWREGYMSIMIVYHNTSDG